MSPFPMNPKTTVNGELGYVFGGMIPDSYCFVPEELVSTSGEGRPAINEVAYFQSGWSVRNMRATDLEPGGSHLFPDQTRLVGNLASPEIEQFLSRLAHRTRHPFA